MLRRCLYYIENTLMLPEVCYHVPVRVPLLPHPSCRFCFQVQQLLSFLYFLDFFKEKSFTHEIDYCFIVIQHRTVLLNQGGRKKTATLCAFSPQLLATNTDLLYFSKGKAPYLTREIDVLAQGASRSGLRYLQLSCSDNFLDRGFLDSSRALRDPINKVTVLLVGHNFKFSNIKWASTDYFRYHNSESPLRDTSI